MKYKYSVFLYIVIVFFNSSFCQKTNNIKSAQNCKKCHKAIYEQWQSSRHAHSTPSTNPLFASIYKLSQMDSDGETKLYCIRCHAPVSQINGDTELTEDITNEGITCDICHTIVELSDEPEYWPNRYQPGKVKQGVFKDSQPKGHKTVYSEMLTTSEICSGCHGDMLDIPGMRSCGNLTICDTDFEWKATSFAESGERCRDCHMNAVSGKAAKNGPEREKIFQHNFSGAYSQDMLEKAAELNLDVKEFEGDVILTLDVINSGVGHLLPTGPPARMMFVKLTAKNGNGEVVWSNFSENPVAEDPYGVFHIVFADQIGKVPSMPWLAVKIVKDTRLRPGENRQLVYKFPAQEVERIEAKLFYRLAPSQLLDKFEITDESLRKTYLMAQIERVLTVE